VSTEPTVVVGGSVAALACADALAAAGRPVELHLPERGIGGGFLPLEIAGRRLDLGPRVLELRYDDDPGVPPPWDAYVPGPHGHRPFLGVVDAFVDGLVGGDLVEVPAPQVSVGGRRCTDYVLAGDLSGLPDAIDADVLAALADEAAHGVEREGRHGVFDDAREVERWQRTMADVGRAQTGSGFHDLLIEPIARKILPGGSLSVVAALHRKIWLPLFHPVTAWEACTGRLAYRPDRPFHTVEGGGMGEVVRRLVDRVSAAPTVSVERSGPLTSVAAGAGGVALGFGDGPARVARRPVVGVGAEELFGAAGIELAMDRVPTTMVWVDLPDEDVLDLPSVLFSAEPGLGVMRVTDSRADAVPGCRTACCEVAWDVHGRPAWEAAALDGLLALGIASSVERAEVVAAASRPAFAVPSAANRDRFGDARRRFDGLGLDLAVVGAATSFGVDSFNEQVVQGLAAAHRILDA
jgi:hypothetical protein